MELAALHKAFTVPAVLAVTGLGGLVGALVGEGAWDTVAVVAAGLPLAVLAWAISRRRQS
jgi:hypothetical protein